MRRVLIVDDEVFYASFVAKIFGKRRWLPMVCLSMEEALKVINTMHLDLVITDIFMPGIGGIKGIELIKLQVPDIPVIAISGGWDTLGPDEAVRAAVHIGADGGLAKPIKPDELASLLNVLGLGGTEFGKPDWPQTPNETTDWDIVFDSPGNGLSAWISEARSFDLLKISALNIVTQLFQNARKDEDASEHMERLVGAIKRGNQDNPAETKKVILGQLNEIKTAFIEEDARFIAERNQERASERKAIRSSAEQDTAVPSPMKKYALAAGAAVLVLAAILMFTLSGEDDPKPATKVTKSKKSEKSKKPPAQKAKANVEKVEGAKSNPPAPMMKMPLKQQKSRGNRPYKRLWGQ